MQLIHLEVFLAVVEEHSLAGAARRLNFSASRVTERLQELERELGVDLVDRSTRRLVLTSAGESLVPRAKAIRQELDIIRSLFPARPREEILVGVRSIPRDFRDRFVKTVRVGAGKAEVSVLPLDSATQIQMLLAGTLDCGVMWEIPPYPLKHRMILSETLGVAVPATSRFRGLEFVEPSDLAGLKLAAVVNPAKAPANTSAYLEYLPHVELVNSSVADAIYLLVSGGRHCSIVPLRSTEHATLAEETRRNILVLPMAAPAPHLGSYFVWHESAETAPRLGAFIRHILSKYPQPEIR